MRNPRVGPSDCHPGPLDSAAELGGAAWDRLGHGIPDAGSESAAYVPGFLVPTSSHIGTLTLTPRVA
jgi:hypothetical protein